MSVKHVKHAKTMSKNTNNNATKNNATIKFETIEKSIATMVIGTKCGYTKYNDNKNGYIGIKYGNANVFSMFHLRNENNVDGKTAKTDGFSIGTTNDLFKVLNESYKTNDGIQFIDNGNSCDKKRNNLLTVNNIKLVYELFQFVVNHFTKPVETEPVENK